MVVAQAMMLKKREFTWRPISSRLLMSSSMATSTKGSTAPFTTCERIVIFTSGRLGHRMTACSGDDQSGVEPVEERRLAELLVQSALKTQALADGIGRGDGQDAGGKERGVEQSHG